MFRLNLIAFMIKKLFLVLLFVSLFLFGKQDSQVFALCANNGTTPSIVAAGVSSQEFQKLDSVGNPQYIVRVSVATNIPTNSKVAYIKVGVNTFANPWLTQESLCSSSHTLPIGSLSPGTYEYQVKVYNDLSDFLSTRGGTFTITAQPVQCYKPCVDGVTQCATGLSCVDSNGGYGIPLLVCGNSACPGRSTCNCSNTPTPTMRPPTATPVPKTCYQECNSDSECAAGYSCVDSNEGYGVPLYVCGNVACPGRSSCNCSNTPTPTPRPPTATPVPRTCYQECTTDSQCLPEYKCRDSNEGQGVPLYVCVNEACPGRSSCNCSNTPTPTQPPVTCANCDTDNNGCYDTTDVTGVDETTLRACFGKSLAAFPSCTHWDVNLDNIVDISDHSWCRSHCLCGVTPTPTGVVITATPTPVSGTGSITTTSVVNDTLGYITSVTLGANPTPAKLFPGEQANYAVKIYETPDANRPLADVFNSACNKASPTSTGKLYCGDWPVTLDPYLLSGAWAGPHYLWVVFHNSAASNTSYWGVVNKWSLPVSSGPILINSNYWNTLFQNNGYDAWYDMNGDNVVNGFDYVKWLSLGGHY